MLMQIKAGGRNLGANSFFRLCEVERAAGLESGSVIEKTLVKAGLMSPRTPAEQEMFQSIILEKVASIELACSELRAILSRQIKVEITPQASFDEPPPFAADQERLKEKLFKLPVKHE